MATDVLSMNKHEEEWRCSATNAIFQSLYCRQRRSDQKAEQEGRGRRPKTKGEKGTSFDE